MTTTTSQIYLKRDSDEWNQAWAALFAAPENEGYGVADDRVSEDQWQYMGTGPNALGAMTHLFRHRNHPRLQDRVYLEILVSENFNAADHQ